MNFSAYVFDALHKDATLVPCRGRDRTRAGKRLCLTHRAERGHGHIVTPVGSRVARASGEVS